MPRHRLSKGFGYPEVILALLIIAQITFAAFWFRASMRIAWSRTAGRVITADVEQTHINSPEYVPKVDVVYEYAVDGETFIGEYTGFWPETGSPNAMFRTQLDRLRSNDAPLIVLYNPESPAQSHLHDGNRNLRQFLFWLLVATLALTVYYVFRVYPRWRGGRQRPFPR